MLVPVGTEMRARPQRPLRVDVKPLAQGDDTQFRARIDVTPGWQPYYRKWIRQWKSPKPEILTIRDEYQLASGSGVEFYWQTKLPVQKQGDRYVIVGKKGLVTLSALCDETRLEVLPLAGGDTHNRITWCKNGRSGVVEVTARLPVRDESK